MANTTLGTLSTISAATVATTDRLLLRDVSANTDYALQFSDLKTALTSSAVAISVTDNTNEALRVTQLGTGLAIRVEDATNPDATPFVVTANGDVGIGTTAPNAKLEISGITSGTATFTGSITGTTLTVSALTSGTILVGHVLHGTASLIPHTRIVSQISGTTGGVGDYLVSISQTLASSTLYGVLRNNSIRITNTDTSENIGQFTGSLEFYGNDASTPGQGVYAYVSAIAQSTSPDTALIFGTRDSAITTDADATERMRITPEGRIGIGTSVPNVAFEIKRQYADILLSANSQVYVCARANANTGYNETLMSAGPTESRIDALATGGHPLVPLNFYVNNTKRMAISANGEVSTTGKLTVGGDLTLNSTLSSSATAFDLINTANTVTAFNASRSLTLGYTGTATASVNFVTGATASAATKTINIGTGGVVGSTTNILLGSGNGGSVTVSANNFVYPNAPTTSSAASYYYTETSGSAGVLQRKTLANATAELVTNASVASAMGIASSDVVTLNDTQTLTNKSFDRLTDSIAPSYTNTSGTVNLNFTTYSTQKITPTAATTLTATVPPAGTTTHILVYTSGTTSYNITFSTGFKATAALATGTVTVKLFALTFISDGSNLIETSRTTAM